MNLLLIIMNSYVIVWSYMDAYDFVNKRISDLEHSLTFFINIFSPGLYRKLRYVPFNLPYVHIPSLSNAGHIFSHLAELKAFLTSRAASRQYFLLPRFHRFPEIASLTLPATSLMASSVDLPFLKPY